MTDAPQHPGILCPRCGCPDLRVYRTSRRERSRVRVRICRHCGRRVQTREQIRCQEDQGGKAA
jgi:hypothetical protein